MTGSPDLIDWAQFPITKLPPEILEHVLEQIKPKQSLVPLDKRNCLSVESLATILPISATREACTRIPFPNGSGICEKGGCCAVPRWRLVCKAFSRVGLDRQFLRVYIRFSEKGFEKLRCIYEDPDLARQVKQFSYMLPRFYRKDEAWFESILSDFQQALKRDPRPPRFRCRESDLDQIGSAMAMASEQRRLIEQKVDSRTILQAFKNFKNLEQIRVMTFRPYVEAAWIGLLRRNPLDNDEFRTEYDEFGWTDAFERAAKILSVAVDQSNSSVSRFSSRILDPPTPVILPPNLQAMTARIGRRLRALEVQIGDGIRTLDEKTLDLSELFDVVFNELVNLQYLHVGFARQVTVPLDTVFHGITFKYLRHIGLHHWLTSSQELINLIERHQNTLRSLRLGQVKLRLATEESPGGWKDVLQFMRRNLKKLNHQRWVSLRRIGYDGDAQAMADMPAPVNSYVGIFDDSDSDFFGSEGGSTDDLDESDQGEEEEDGDAGNQDDQEEQGDSEREMGSERANSEGGIFSEVFSGSEDERPAEEQEPDVDIDDDFLVHADAAQQPNPATDNIPGAFLASGCGCESGYGWDGLDDNGMVVERAQWKYWEKWVVMRCPTHDPAY